MDRQHTISKVAFLELTEAANNLVQVTETSERVSMLEIVPKFPTFPTVWLP